MKNPAAERDRWLKQADHDLAIARRHLTGRFFSDACYMAEQAAQTALKAYLYGRGERQVREHSIQELLGRAAKHERRFSAFVEAGKILDQYYVATRYPDALPLPTVPYEAYTEAQARGAIATAERILEAVRAGR